MTKHQRDQMLRKLAYYMVLEKEQEAKEMDLDLTHYDIDSYHELLDDLQEELQEHVERQHENRLIYSSNN